MAKIEFSANFKDAELVANSIKNLQKEFSQLAQVGNASGQTLSKTMQTVKEMLAGMNDMSKTTSGIKGLVVDLEALSKTGSSIKNFTATMGEAGKAIDQALGDSQVNKVSKVRDMIATLKNEVKDYGEKLQEINFNLPIIEGRHGRDSKEYREAILQRDTTVSAAMIRSTHLDQLNNSIGEGNKPPVEPPSALERFQNFKNNPYVKALGAIGTGITFASEALDASTMGTNAWRRQRMRAGMEAEGGNPTQAITDSLGLGVEEFGARDTLNLAKNVITKGIMGNIMHALSFGMVGQFTGASGILAANSKDRQDLNADTFGTAIQAGYGQYRRAYGMFEDGYRMYGDSAMNSRVSSFMRQGMGMDRLGYGLGQSLYYGTQVHALNPSDMLMLDAQRRLGTSQGATGEMIRLARANGSGEVMGNYRAFMSNTGIGMDINSRRMMSDYVMQQAQNMGGNFDDFNSNTGIQAGTRAAAATGLYNSAAGGINVEGTQVAIQAAQMVGGAIANPMNAANAMYSQTLISLGVTNAMARQTLIQILAANGGSPDSRVVSGIQAVQRSSGKQVMSAEEIRAAFNKGTSAVADFRKRTVGGGKQGEALKEAGIDVRGFAAGGTAASAVNGLGDIIDATLRGTSQNPGVGPGTGALEFNKIGQDAIEAGQGKSDAMKLDSFQLSDDDLQRRVGQTVYKAIADSLVTAGGEIKRQMQEAIEDKNNSTNPNYSVFGGTGKNSMSGK